MRIREMPIIGGRQHKTDLDERLCFQLWIERGTAKKAAQAMLDEYGIDSPRKPGEPYSRRAFDIAAKRYVLWNPDEARVLYEDHYGSVEDRVWKGFIHRVYKAILKYYSGEKAVQWRKEFPEYWEFIEQNS